MLLAIELMRLLEELALLAPLGKAGKDVLWKSKFLLEAASEVF